MGCGHAKKRTGRERGGRERAGPAQALTSHSGGNDPKHELENKLGTEMISWILPNYPGTTGIVPFPT